MANTAEGSHAHGEYPGPPQPLANTIFESVLHDIFPWTVIFSNSKTTSDTDKVVLSKHNITNGVEKPNWKEITFFLPSKISITILGNKVDYGELPHIIFHSDMFKSALAVILNTTDDLHVCVCPGISDPALTDVAERKRQRLIPTQKFPKYPPPRGFFLFSIRGGFFMASS